jgi:hypothetical protein
MHFGHTTTRVPSECVTLSARGIVQYAFYAHKRNAGFIYEVVSKPRQGCSIFTVRSTFLAYVNSSPFKQVVRADGFSTQIRGQYLSGVAPAVSVNHALKDVVPLLKQGQALRIAERSKPALLRCIGGADRLSLEYYIKVDGCTQGKCLLLLVQKARL